MLSEIKNSLLITLDFPPNFGGVAAYYYNVCVNLPSGKIAVLASAGGQTESFDSSQKFKIIRGEFYAAAKRRGFIPLIIDRFKFYFVLSKKVIEIISAEKIELLQIGNILPLGALALLIKKRKNVPYLVYAHGLDVIYPQNFWRKKILLKKIIKEASVLVANSKFTKNELVKLGADEAKIAVAYPCADLELIDFAESEIKRFRAAHQLEGKKILLTAGRLVERKGHDQVIKAMPQIIKGTPNAVYLIAGDGPYLDRLKRLAADYCLEERVKFLGPVNRNDLALCYRLCDVFIMPSRQLDNGDAEGFGIVYLEANIYGKPAIGGRSGGVPEAVEDGRTGLLVDPENTAEIAQAAVRLLNDRELARALGAQGAARVREQFTWERQAEKIKQAIIRLCRQP